jgi:urea transport system ATP-binding protein
VPSVFRELTVRENLAIASCKGVSLISNIGFGLSRLQQQRIDEILELTALTDARDRIAANLSHGETQWLELGLVIVQDPKVLLLDEPTAGMTESETRKTAEIINNLRGQYTVLVVEHDMAFIRQIAEQITVMHLGRILAEGDITAVENNAEVRAAYLGAKGIH